MRSSVTERERRLGRRVASCMTFAAVLVAVFAVTVSANAQDNAPREAEADSPDEAISLTLPPEVELGLLIDMVSDELAVPVLYDADVAKKRVTIRAPAKIPRGSLLRILESALKMQGHALSDAEQPGWLKVVDAKNLTRESTEFGGHCSG